MTAVSVCVYNSLSGDVQEACMECVYPSPVGGAGGKGTWGKLVEVYDDDGHTHDNKDPNYDSEDRGDKGGREWEGWSRYRLSYYTTQELVHSVLTTQRE